MVEVYSLRLKIEPSLPKNIELKELYEKTVEVLNHKNLNNFLALSLTGSRVWGVEGEESDIDVLAYGYYNDVLDIITEFKGKELEITTIPINDVIEQALPYETRWDIISSVPFTASDEAIIAEMKKSSLLTLDEINCILSHIIFRLSWLGIAIKPFTFKNIKIYSLISRYMSLPRANTYNLLFYALDLLSIAQYVLNGLPYPFAKWRLLHLDKLYNVSHKLLEFVKLYKNDYIELRTLSTLTSDVLLETLDLINSMNYLKNGLENEDLCRQKLKLYPYF
ncbi:MAG: hypothetical protein QXK24_01505 [Ignisphaera sp.]